jgi:transketolase
MSDGECQEGTTWETALIAAHQKLSNLTAVIDRNRLQSLASTEDTVALDPLTDKWTSFGWNVIETNGHEHLDLFRALSQNDGLRPTCIIANTVKGKGVSFMENRVEWHYRSPSDEQLRSALTDLA